MGHSGRSFDIRITKDDSGNEIYVFGQTNFYLAYAFLAHLIYLGSKARKTHVGGTPFKRVNQYTFSSNVEGCLIEGYRIWKGQGKFADYAEADASCHFNWMKYTGLDSIPEQRKMLLEYIRNTTLDADGMIKKLAQLAGSAPPSNPFAVTLGSCMLVNTIDRYCWYHSDEARVRLMGH